MMESCLNYKPERVTAITVEDLKKDLLDDFSNISTSSQESLSDKEHLQVYLRVRPFTNTEQEAGESQECVEVVGPDTVVLKAPRTSLSSRLSEKPVQQTAQRFRFSQVYGPDTTQRQMFNGTAKSLVKDVLEGGNSLIFTYGVTNAGKTFTFLGPESDSGIVPRSLRVIFNSIEDRIYTQNNIKPHRCMDFTRLTKDQQEEESTSKKNLLRRLKETDSQKSLTCKTLLEGSTSSDIDMQAEEESFSLDSDSNTKYSVWVSFCEIYNETIHDLLEVLPSGPLKRTALRLSQDVKGNTFVKDLKWIQVNSAEEAYRVLKIGRKNQSFSSTKLNNVSSRSHSIFSIRILRIEDVGVPRVLTISELSLCDLAGSERCAKTQNKGERLKEAGNINSSLLTLGKCITALRLNQTQPKYQPHIPFRESKLTHYLQGFFCGRGKACMVVNINQCASMYDETLNVLKFSAVAQKVVVLTTRPVVPKQEKSGREVSFIINDADRRHLWAKRRSTLMAWETTLEDVQEDEDDEEREEMEEEEDEEEEDSADETVAEGTVLEAGDEDLCEAQHAEIQQLKARLTQKQEENLAMESRIREEVTTEFMELFSKMESDYNERLQKEKEIIEERAERRLEILKDLVKKNASEFAAASAEETTKEERMEFMDNVIEAMRSDLAKIKRDAAEVQTCLVSAESPTAIASLRKQVDDLAEELLTSQQHLGLKTSELESMQAQAQRSTERLQGLQESYECQTLKVQELIGMCHEKDGMIAKLQGALDHSIEATTKDRSLIDTIREEILHFKQNCRCGATDGGTDDPSDLNKDARRGSADVPRGADDRAEAEETEKLNADIQRLLAEAKAKDERLDELGQKLFSLEQSVQEVTAALADETQLHEAALASLDRERLELASLEAERNALAKERDRLQAEVEQLTSKIVAAETEARGRAVEAAKAEEEVARLSLDLLTAHQQAKERETEALEKSKMAAALEREVERLKEAGRLEASRAEEEVARLGRELRAARAQAKELEEEAQEKSKMAAALEQEVERLKEKARGEARQTQGSGPTFSEALRGLKEECESLARASLGKSERIKELESERDEARSQVQQLEEVCGELEQLCDHQQAEAQSLQAQLDAGRLALDEAKERHAELQKEAQGLREQLARAKEQLRGSGERRAELERQLQEAETQRHCLEEKLKEAQSQNGGEQQSQQDKLATAELQETLAQQKANMEAVTRELSDRKEQVQENLEVIKSLGQDLKLKDRDISWLKERLRERESEIEQLLYKISRINDENSSLQRRLSDTERIKNETLIDLRLKDQTILELKTEQPGGVQLAESAQHSPKVEQDFPPKERFIRGLRSALSEQRMPAEQEQLLEAKLKEIESLTAELMNLKERCQLESLSPSSCVERGTLSDVQPDENGQLKVEDSMRRVPETPVSEAEELQQRSRTKSGKPEGMVESTPKPKAEDTEQGSAGLDKPQGDTTSLTQEILVLDSTEVICGSTLTRRFPNQSDLDISFTPPTDRVNRWVQWDSEERPKPSPKQNRLRRTSRKRKKLEGHVQSENRSEEQTKKMTPMKRLSQMNHQESPTVLGKAASEIRQQGSPACLKNKRPQEPASQTDSHSTQPTPAGLRSKVAKTASRKSPEPQSGSQAGRPRRTKRKLYKADNSAPLDIGSPPVMAADQDDKESDHLIIKRKLRTRTVKV